MLRLLILTMALAMGLAQAQEVRAAVAANFRDAFNELARAFAKANPGVRVVPSFGSSGAFAQQIVSGAPFDLFLAADMTFPRMLEAQNLAEPGTLRVYARGKLALFVPGAAAVKGLEALRDLGFRRVVVANPETAPYGKAAVQALQASGLYDLLKPRLVFAQDTAQAAQLTLTAAEAGFIAYSAVFTPAFKGKGGVFVVPQRLYDPLDQGVLVVRGRGRPEVRAFYSFLRSPEASRIIKAHGYQTSDSL